MKKTVFIKNAAILTVSSFILRVAGIFLKVWLAAKIGAEGIGLYQLVFSVYMFAATFATSGICTAVTRMVSEELVVGNKLGIKRMLLRCIQISIFIALVSIIVLFFGAQFIANFILHQPNAALSLKILGFSLPFMSVCSCLKGYFIARRKAAPSSVSQLLEQAVRIIVIIPLVLKYNRLGLGYTCAAVFIGDTFAEAFSCLYIYLRFKLDFKKLSITTPLTRKSYKLLPVISHIALPITSGRYLNSLLRMTENILVPICLSNSLFHSNGISLFGMIKGMALPILFFPSTLLYALSTLLLPEISEAAVRGRKGVLKTIVSRIIKITSLVAIIFSGVFLVCGRQIGVLIYKSQDVGFLICALFPIVPFMYLDAISDGILKGLDKQKFTFYTSVSDSVIRIIFVLLFLKQFGILGFIGIMYFSNFFTCFLNTKQLIKSSGAHFNLTQTFFIPICCSFGVCLLARFLLNMFNLPNGVYVALVCIICMPVYLGLLFLFKIINYNDINFIKLK